MSDDPNAEVLRIIPPSRHGGAYTVRIRCPYCRQSHEHGLGADGNAWGHRRAHCTNPGGYYVNRPAEETSGETGD